MPKQHILIVEDERDIAALIKHTLERNADIEADTVFSGDTALKAMTERPPDLVVLDLNLPLISGFEVHRELMHHVKHVPVVVVTGLAPERTRALNVSHVLHKPIMPEALVRAVVDCLAGRRSATG